MQDWLSQLISLAPGMAAGAKGNGDGMRQFMEAYQRTSAQLQDQTRQKQLMTQQGEDRTRMITRQDAADAEHRQDRAALATQRGQADALQTLSIPGQLAELGGTADTEQDARRLIESVMPRLLSAFGQDTMAMGEPAVEMAGRTITARQKRQVKDFVDSALKTSHVADNPDADPEITNLPAHLQNILGKGAAKLSELQQFAELPVGKTAGKPSDDVSLQQKDMLVNGKLTPVNFNPKTGTYTDQSGAPVRTEAVPPRPLSSIDGRSPAAVATFNQIASQYQRSPLTNAADRTIVLKDAAAAIKRDPANASNQMALAYSYIQALDTYQSAVREGELQNLGALATRWQQLQVEANRVATSGAFMPPDVAKAIAEASDRLVQTIESGRNQKRAEFGARAKASGVGDLWNEFISAIPGSVPSPQPSPTQRPAPKVGTTVRNKKTGELVEVTGVRPDGSVIVKPLVKQ